MGRLDGKVAIVTGAATGLGSATAELFATESAGVVVTDVNEPAGQAVADRIRRAGGRATFMELDVSREEDWKRVVADTVDAYGKLNVLVNNAGIGGFTVMDRGDGLQRIPSVEGATLPEFEAVMRVNCTGVFLGMKYAIEAMKGNAELCSIINRSSIYGQLGEATEIAYCASKGAVTLMTKSAALAMAAEGLPIRVNSVHPGFIRTCMVEEDARNWGISADEHCSTLAAATPMGVLGEPIDIAYVDLYLASDESRWTTGAEFTIDGGFSAR